MSLLFSGSAAGVWVGAPLKQNADYVYIRAKLSGFVNLFPEGINITVLGGDY
jgi:hypothetical protein